MFEFSAPFTGPANGGLTRRTVRRSSALVSSVLPGLPRIGPLPSLRTDRLSLRPFTVDDFAAIHAIMSADESFAHSGRRSLSPSETWARLARNERHWRRFGFGRFAVEEVASGTLIGEVGHLNFMRRFGPAFDGMPEASWTLASAHWGKGFAAEAANAAHRWLYECTAFDRTVCVIMAENHSSIRLAERIGYRPLAEINFRGFRAATYHRLANAASRQLSFQVC